jgi:hypothetical protein
MSETKEVKTISLDNPEFSNPQTYDPEQDIDERIPPPELDNQGNVLDYLFKLSTGPNKQGEKNWYPATTKKGNGYIALNVKVQIVDPGQPHDKAFVNMMPLNTILYNNTSSMVNMARLLGSLMPQGLSPIQQGEYVKRLIDAEPVLPGRLQWSAYCTNCDTEIGALAGERRWPEKKDENGNVIGHEYNSECPDCKTEVHVNPKIDKFFRMP